MFIFLENALNLAIFTYVPPRSKFASKVLSSHHRQKEIIQSPKRHFFENLFPPTAERGGGNYKFLYQSSVRKYEDDLGHYVIYVLCHLYFFQR